MLKNFSQPIQKSGSFMRASAKKEEKHKEERKKFGCFPFIVCDFFRSLPLLCEKMGIFLANKAASLLISFTINCTQIFTLT
jgi:hypothetical protein